MNKHPHPVSAPQPGTAAGEHDATNAGTRLDSKELFRHAREIEIAHDGRIYRLRLTQLNKLILTA